MLSEIVNRRSIRAYLPRLVSRADIETVLRAGALAPSSKNRQPWRFTVTLGAKKEESLAAMARGLEEEARRPLLPESTRHLGGAIPGAYLRHKSNGPGPETGAQCG